MKTIVLQSCYADPPPWIEHCLASVRHWAALQGHHYHFIGDSLFERLPAALRARPDLPRLPLTDIARLGFLREQLAAGHERVIWIDADVVIFRPEQFTLPPSDGALLCFEAWTWLDEQGQLACKHKINNAVMAFERGHPLLDFLLHASVRLIGQRPADGIHPTLVGPMLLSALGSAVPLDVFTQVATLPPALIAALIQPDSTGLLAEFCRLHPYPMHAANLCRSLLDPLDQRLTGDNRVALSETEMLAAVSGLIDSRGTLLDHGEVPQDSAAGFSTLANY